LNELCSRGSEEDLETIRTLLDDGADLNAQSHEGFTPFHRAVENAYNEEVRAIASPLLDRGADTDHAPDPLGMATSFKIALWRKTSRWLTSYNPQMNLTEAHV